MKTVTELLGKLSEEIKSSIASYDAIKSDDIFELLENIVYHDNLVAFKAVIEAGVDLNLQNKYGWTPLHISIRRNRKEMVEFLLEKGADIDKTDGVGWTPLMEAIMDDMPELCGYLVAKGADITIANQRGGTAPMLVQKFGRSDMEQYFS